MLEAMISAHVGDDVFGEDPTVNKLEALVCEMFSMEASLFCPSGTMANQVAIKCHTQPGDEVICEKMSHVHIYEGGGIAFNSSCAVKAIDGDRCRINAAQVEQAINPDDVHKPVSSLVSLENTANRGGGSCYDITEIQSIRQVCLKYNLRLHLDGSRLFNALVAQAESPRQYGELFDSISICLSKGLGAPVGSVLMGNRDFIKKARRVRKVLGGGLRQAGYLAAAGIYALENNIPVLENDHNHAKYIAHRLLKKEFIGKMMPVETNIVIFEIIGDSYTAESFVAYLAEKNILCLPISANQVRMVTHLDISTAMIENLTHVLDHM